MNKQGKFLRIPYDFRIPTIKIFKERFWNKNNHRIFTPKVFGWGYSLNFHGLLRRIGLV